MRHIRAALYLDFDNVFGGLFKLDPEVAIQFANNPGAWLRRLSTTQTMDGPRRWLTARCYLNPNGWVGHHDTAGEPTRLYFSRFRPSFVRAGFEVIDCPRFSAMKNGADIRIVVDAVDALSADTVHEEFVILSGDSDMTPLLQRLRRSDRRTMVVSPADAAEAFVAIADRILDGQQMLALVQGQPIDFDDSDTDITDAGDVTDNDTGAIDRSEAYERFRASVVARYASASTPLNLATLAQQLRHELGIDDSDWFGFGGFARAVTSLKLPNLRLSQHLMWDDGRHPAPDLTALEPQRTALPEPVARLAETISLPRLPQPSWPAIYRALSDYARVHPFNLTQCTAWSRDRLHAQDVTVSRSAVAFVVRGTSYGGCPLFRQPPPEADEIGAAFVASVLNSADAAGIAFGAEEIATVRAWLTPLPGETVGGPRPEKTGSSPVADAA